MKYHLMSLTSRPMKSIRAGTKTIELRLYDEKRQKIAIGDTIKFVNAENLLDTMSVIVEDLFVFDSFDELYKQLPLTECGYTEDDIEKASPSDMDYYYSKEKQSKYKVVGIKIKHP